jgi:hypothetical protein
MFSGAQQHLRLAQVAKVLERKSLQRGRNSALILNKKGMDIDLLWLVVYECA